MRKILSFRVYERLYKLLTAGLISLLIVIGVISCTNSFSWLPSNSMDSAARWTSHSHPHTLDQILHNKEIRIAIAQDFAPFSSLEGNQPQGYDVDVAKLLAEALGVKLKLVPVTTDRRIPALLENEVDAIIAHLSATPERALFMYFSKAYVPYYSGLYGGLEVEASNYEDLKSYQIGVTGDTVEEWELTKNAPPGTNIQRYNTPGLMFNALLSGEVDAIVTSHVAAAKIMQDNPTRNIGQKFILRNSACSIGVPHGDLDFVQWLDVFITSKKLSGELDQLSEKWFGEPLGELPT